MIRLRTLGESIIEVDGESLTPESDSLFAALVYLTVERGRQIPRTALADLLWPTQRGPKARHCLRQLLYRLRIAGVAMEAERETLVLPESLIMPTFCAAPSIERHVAERSAGTLVIGSFLPGYWPTFSEPYAEWLEQARGNAETRVRRVLLEVLHAHRMRADWPEVDAAASDLLLLDPLNEEATFARAEAAIMVGAKTEALGILDRYVGEIGPARAELHLPATVLRRRIAERFPAPRYAAPSERTFFGRASIMSTLTTALMRARSKQGSAHLIYGDAGIGKTRIVQELTRVATIQGVRVVRVWCEESDVNRPMAAFADSVPQLRAIPGAIGASPESLGFLDRLTEPHVASASAEPPADPRWIAGRIRQAILDLLDALASEVALLLVIEDVHWLDASSWAAIGALLDWLGAHRFMLLLTSRGSFPAPFIPVKCVERLEAHAVAPLSDADAGALVTAIAKDHGGKFPEDARAWAVSVGEGNPLFLRELAVHCLEGGAVHQAPPSLRNLIDARLSRVSSTARRVLEAIVLLADLSAMERLTAVLELEANVLGDALAELASGLLISETAVMPRARHELISVRVLESMPRTLRALVHRRIALVLSATHTHDSARLLAVASHWTAAGETSLALTSLLDAAGALQRIGAVKDAIQLLDAASELSIDQDRRIIVLRRLRDALALDAQWQRALDASETLCRTSSHSADRESREQDVLLLLDARFRTGVEPTRLFAEAIALVEDARLSPHGRIVAARHAVVIAANCSGTEIDRLRTLPVESIIASATFDSVDRLELETIYHVSFGNMQHGLACAKQLRQISLSDDISFDSLRHRGIAATALRAAGFIDEAVKEFQGIYQFAKRESLQHFTLRSAHYLAEMLIDANQVHDGRHWLEVAYALASGSESKWHSLTFLENEARIAGLEGRIDDAFRYSREFAEAVQGASDSPFWQRVACTALAVETKIFAREPNIPTSEIEALERVHLERRATVLHDRVAATLFTALRVSGANDRADQLMQEYVALHRRSLTPFRSPDEVLGFGTKR